MKIFKSSPLVKNLAIITTVLVSFSSCQEAPIADFSYTPTENCEAGESVSFINNSTAAVSYEWDFGNGIKSSLENPIIMYNSDGSFDVTLTATNQNQSTSTTQVVMIKKPTILGIYAQTNDTKIPIASCRIKVFETETDFIDQSSPLFNESSNNLGYVEFHHLESQVYYVSAKKEISTGVWMAEGTTESLGLNQSNVLSLICKFYPNEN